MFDLAGRAKWDAWSNAGKVYAGNGQGAEQRYLDIARELGWVSGSGVGSRSQNKGEVWDEDLGMRVPLSSEQDGGGMGVSVSTMAARGDQGNDTGGHMLHAFAIQGDANNITRFLAESPGVDVNQRDEHVWSSLSGRYPGDDVLLQGYTALHLACDRGSLQVVKVLIEHGADPTIKVCLDYTWIPTQSCFNLFPGS